MTISGSQTLAHRRHREFLPTPELMAAMVVDPAITSREIPINQLQLCKLIAGRMTWS